MIQGMVDLPVDLFGGEILDINPADLPPGGSPDNQNLIFTETGPRTRPGLGIGVFTAIGTRDFNYTKTVIFQDGTMQALAYGSASTTSTLYKEATPGTLSTLYEPLTLNMYPVSTTLFGKEWIAMGDGLIGADLPRQYDGKNFDRVSQGGPGLAPSAIDENLSYSLVASPNGAIPSVGFPVDTLSESGNLCTMVATIADTASLVVLHQLKVGDPMQISAAGVAGYDGQFTVAAVSYGAPSGGFVVLTVEYVNTNTGLAGTAVGTFTPGLAYLNFSSTIDATMTSIVITGMTNPAWDNTYAIRDADATGVATIVISDFTLTASGGAVVTVAGQGSLGVYKVSVVFVTRQGYITAPAFPSSFTSLGSRRKIVANIPVGPPNVVQRIVLFTGAGGGNFFYIAPGPTVPPIAVTVIPDNTTTTATFDFSDTELFAGVSADDLFNLIVLGQCAGVVDYGERLMWIGELNKLNNFVNMGFDGGIDANGFPLGWTPDPVSSAGGSVVYTNYALWAGTYKITSGLDGGLITQSAYQDPYQVPLLEAGRSYSVRARIRTDIIDGFVNINLTSASAAHTTTGLVVHGTVGSFGRFSAVLTDATIEALPSIPADLKLQVYASGAFAANNWYIDEIEIFPTDTPINNSLVRVSRAEDPESYDGVTGFMQVSQGDGYANHAIFKLRDNRVYVTKEVGMYSTQDDGVNEPSSWTIDTVSKRVGTVSTRGVAVGEDWATVVAREGLYVFWGPEPIKISPEMQPLWNRINWAYGKKIWSQLDIRQRRGYVGVPLDSSQVTNTILYLDYRDLDSAEMIAANPPIHVSYSGRKVCKDKARKWSVWPISVNSAALIERPTGQQELWFGGQGDGLIFQPDPANLNDNGTAIDSYYQFSFLPSLDQEQQLQLKAHRKLFGYLTMFVEGAGNLQVTAFSPGSRTEFRLPFIKLRYPEERDRELLINLPGLERCSFKVRTNALTDWFRIAKFCPVLSPDPYSPVRGL